MLRIQVTALTGYETRFQELRLLLTTGVRTSVGARPPRSARSEQALVRELTRKPSRKKAVSR